MKFINLNSEYEPNAEQITFSESVLCSDERYSEDKLSIQKISRIIPIYLVNEFEFNNIKSKYNSKDLVNEESLDDNINKSLNPIFFDVLGLYIIKGKNEHPEIYLCMEAIKKYSKDDEEFILLFTLVLIHELAHAYMDKSIYVDKDDFYLWMEEGFANKITLDIFKEYVNNNNNKKFKVSPFYFVKNFITKQPLNYKFGLDLFEHQIESKLWYKNKGIINRKVEAKKNWLELNKQRIKTKSKADDNFIENLMDVLIEDRFNELIYSNDVAYEKISIGFLPPTNENFILFGLNPENVTINQDNEIEYKGDVDLSNRGLTKIPFDFKKVDGSFYCNNNQLISLKGSPYIVSGNFYCYNNLILSDGEINFNVSGNFYYFNNLVLYSKYNKLNKHFEFNNSWSIIDSKGNWINYTGEEHLKMAILRIDELDYVEVLKIRNTIEQLNINTELKDYCLEKLNEYLKKNNNNNFKDGLLDLNKEVLDMF